MAYQYQPPPSPPPPPRASPTPWIILGCCIGPIVLLGLFFVGCLGFSFYFANKLGIGQLVQRQLEAERTSLAQAKKKVDRSITIETLYQDPQVADGKWIEVEGYVLLGLDDEGPEFEVGKPGGSGFILVTEEIDRQRKRGEVIDLEKLVMVTYTSTSPAQSPIKLKNGDRVRVLGLASMLDLEFLKSWAGKELEKEGKLPPAIEQGIKVKRTGPPKMVTIFAKEVEKLSP